jgi:hypothetical protein
MIDAGSSGIDEKVLSRFLELLPGLEPLGVFGERFTLELRSRHEHYLFHVNRRRAVMRPVTAEDSKKKVVSLPISHFVRLVEFGDIKHWREALHGGTLRVK